MAGLAAIGAELVGLFAAQLQERGVELPERQHFAPGQIPAADGEQLVGNLVDVHQGQPGAPVGGTMHPSAVQFSATFSVGLLRAIPIIQGDGGGSIDLDIPSSAEIDAAGQLYLSDAEGLLKSCQAIHQSYAVTDPGMGFAIDGLQTLGPDGGLAGVKVLLTVSLS